MELHHSDLYFHDYKKELEPMVGEKQILFKQKCQDKPIQGVSCSSIYAESNFLKVWLYHFNLF